MRPDTHDTYPSHLCAMCNDMARAQGWPDVAAYLAAQERPVAATA